MTRSPRYVLPTHLCRFAVRAQNRCLAVFLGTSGSLASLSRFVRSLTLVQGGLPSPAGRAPSRGRPEPRRATPIRRRVGRDAHLRCRNVHLLRFGYACRPRLSPRLTLGGLASPRKPRVHGGRVTLSSLATHASILAPARSTEGRPSASPRAGRSPTRRARLRESASSAPCLAPCIVGARPLGQ